jgi:zinc transport system substrate-binding protein
MVHEYPHSCPRSLRLAGAAIPLLVLALSLTLAAPRPATAADPLAVFASVVPVQRFADIVGAELVNARALVKPGASPATYEPTPSQMADLARARVYFSCGVPFEKAWLPRLRQANPDLDVVAADAGIDKTPIAGHGTSDGRGEVILDPHVWLSPPLAMKMAANIRDGLIQADPENSLAYRRGYQDFKARAEVVHDKIQDILSGMSGTSFLVFHPSWGYFAKTYGLEQLAVEHEGREPGPKALSRLLDRARTAGIRVVFVQPQFSRQAALSVARSLDAEVAVLDPLAADWADNLLRAARAIRDAAGDNG